MPPPPAPIPSAGPSSLPLQPPRQVREKVAPSTVTLKPGTLLIYGDNDVSPVRLNSFLLPSDLLLMPNPSCRRRNERNFPNTRSRTNPNLQQLPQLPVLLQLPDPQMLPRLDLTLQSRLRVPLEVL